MEQICWLARPHSATSQTQKHRKCSGLHCSHLSFPSKFNPVKPLCCTYISLSLLLFFVFANESLRALWHCYNASAPVHLSKSVMSAYTAYSWITSVLASRFSRSLSALSRSLPVHLFKNVSNCGFSSFLMPVEYFSSLAIASFTRTNVSWWSWTDNLSYSNKWQLPLAAWNELWLLSLASFILSKWVN